MFRWFVGFNTCWLAITMNRWWLLQLRLLPLKRWWHLILLPSIKPAVIRSLCHHLLLLTRARCLCHPKSSNQRAHAIVDDILERVAVFLWNLLGLHELIVLLLELAITEWCCWFWLTAVWQRFWGVLTWLFWTGSLDYMCLPWWRWSLGNIILKSTCLIFINTDSTSFVENWFLWKIKLVLE